MRGPTLVQPAIQIDPSLRRLEVQQVQAIAERLQMFVAEQLARHAAPLAAMGDAAGGLFTPPRVRALLATLVDGGGTAPRAAVEAQLEAMNADERPQLRKLGLTIGSLDIFHHQLLKPEAVRWRTALLAAQQGETVPALPPQGAVLQKTGNHTGLRIAGFRRCGTGWLRIDMAERLARQAHAARIQAAAPPTSPVAGGDGHHDHESGDHGESQGAPPPGFLIDPALATSLGLDEETRRALLQSFGFRAVGEPELQRWRWGGLKSADKRKRRKPGKRDAVPKQAAAGERPRQPGKQAKRRHGNAGGKPPRPADPPRAPRPDRVPRRGPSPNSPFAGLAAMLAEAHKD